MTYDIIFVRLRPGRTFQKTLDEINSEYDPDAEPNPMDLTADQRAVWDRIVQRVSREIGPVTSEEYLYSLTLRREGSAGHLQLDYDGDSASISIPYWYPGEAAMPIVEEAYRIARMIEEEAGLVGFDGQTEQHIITGEVTAAAAKLGGMACWAQEHLT